jgi:hypothetical protein
MQRQVSGNRPTPLSERTFSEISIVLGPIVGILGVIMAIAPAGGLPLHYGDEIVAANSDADHPTHQ